MPEKRHLRLVKDNEVYQPAETDSQESIMAKEIMARALRKTVQEKLGLAGGVITPEILAREELPGTIVMPAGLSLKVDDHLVQAFRIKTDLKRRIFFIATPKKPDGRPNFYQQSVIWQEE